MTKDEAIRKALEYATSNDVTAAGGFDAQYFDLERVDAQYVDLERLDALAATCPDDMVETYHSVRRQFRDHWAVTIPLRGSPGTVVSPSSAIVEVFDDGEVRFFDSL